MNIVEEEVHGENIDAWFTKADLQPEGN